MVVFGVYVRQLIVSKTYLKLKKHACHSVNITFTDGTIIFYNKCSSSCVIIESYGFSKK